ncbi:MAG: ATP-binding protein [Desulfocapsaceae bacterium]|jgi:two-component system nitrogen regulation sensor histidine kinase NtrY|nr:ATP-binding protein [Desulfocapsaceae bacterium]
MADKTTSRHNQGNAAILPQKQSITEVERQQKKKLIRRVIVFCLCLIPLFGWFQGKLFEQNLELPVNSNIVIFALININVILLLIVLFLILRNLAELLFERKLNLLGSRLRTKLVISFLSLSLIPTILLFFVALQFISSSVDYWFNASIEDSLQESLVLAQDIIQDYRKQAEVTGNDISIRLLQEQSGTLDTDILSKFLKETVTRTPPGMQAGFTVLSELGNFEIYESTPGLQSILLPKIPVDLMQQVKTGNISKSIIQETSRGDLVRNIRKIDIGPESNNQAVLITSLLISQEKLDRMARISKGIEDYRQLKYLKGPFKFWLLLILLIVTLLIIFAAIWFGIRIARSITEPVDKLAAATRRVAQGEFDFTLESEASNDEIGVLVTSFNTMTADINSSNQKLAETHKALEESSVEADRRRRYTEIILQNVSAGVISLDDHGRITTINRFAEKLLRIQSAHYIGMSYRQALPLQYTLILDRFMEELYITKKTSVEQYLKVTISRNTLSLLVNFTRLEDDDGMPIGFVLVFDNLTKLEKMQRMAAWREVAKRIAHEIKNPLTPIQLSAQRLRRRYPEILEADDSVFDRCTKTIISQVEELKRLVSEFSQFARMPKINKNPGDLVSLTEDTLVLYQEAHKHITFTCTTGSDIPLFNFDAEQIKRSLINLLDNAVAVLSDGGKISVELSVHPESSHVVIKVIDNGPGISDENKLKLFEPYFSTKKSGTGLGLAIVSTIVSDHGGYIRVVDNDPHGSVFIIELPVSRDDHHHDHSHSDY